VVDQLLGSSGEALKMGGETREVTFLVSDLRGFTALTEKLPASKVIPILNRYFESMVEIIARYRGTVDEFQETVCSFLARLWLHLTIRNGR
jgi:class 3 adenylate cyclase